MSRFPRSQLRRAKSAETRAATVAYLEEALNQLDPGAGWEQERAYALAWRDLAYEQDLPEQRRSNFRNALNGLRVDSTRARPQRAALFALIVTDAFDDPYTYFSELETQSVLAQAVRLIDTGSSTAKSPESQAALLQRKSAVLRLQSRFSSDRWARQQRLAEAVRCARRALDLFPSTYTYLELGLGLSAESLRAESDWQEKVLLREAELHLRTAAQGEDVVPLLALAQFLRANYRALDACDVFQSIDFEQCRLRRRVLRSAYVFGEAVNQLTYNHPHEVAERYLDGAVDYLRASLDAGYTDCRTRLALAFLVAHQSGSTTADHELGWLVKNREIDWTLVAERASTVTADQVAQTFVLGLGSSASLTRIGTYFRDIKHDPDVAEAFYRAAVRSRPSDAIALTNLATFLIEQGRPGYVGEAAALLDSASTRAHRRYYWWRIARDRLQVAQDREPRLRPPKRRSLSNPGPSDTAIDLAEVHRRFRVLLGDSSGSTAKRGRELEALVAQAANLTPELEAHSSFREVRPDGRRPEGDGLISHGIPGLGGPAKYYRYECRWTAKPTNKTPIIAKMAELWPDASLLYLSISGFYDTTIRDVAEKCREMNRMVLLMDGHEFESILAKRVPFGQLLELKREAFVTRGEVFTDLQKLGIIA